jgi:hypothetical protein
MQFVVGMWKIPRNVTPFIVCFTISKVPWLGHLFPFEKANLLSLMKMWSLFFAFLPIFYILYFFLPFLLGVFNTAAPNTTFQADDISTCSV